MTTPKKKIQQIVAQYLEQRGQTIEELHREHQDTIDWFWDTVCSEYMLQTISDLDADPKYRFDPEWDEFWDTAEKLYPSYILKPICVKS